MWCGLLESHGQDRAAHAITDDEDCYGSNSHTLLEVVASYRCAGTRLYGAIFRVGRLPTLLTPGTEGGHRPHRLQGFRGSFIQFP